MKNILMLILLFSISTIAIADDRYKTLQIVRDIAKTIPDKKGNTFEDIMSAICITESSLGRDLIGDFKKDQKITKASLGIMQIQVDTVKHLGKWKRGFKWIRKMSDQEIANKLLTDKNFSALIATHYIVSLKNARDNDLFKAISGYNGGMNNKPYYDRVMANLPLVKKWKKEGKII